MTLEKYFSCYKKHENLAYILNYLTKLIDSKVTVQDSINHLQSNVNHYINATKKNTSENNRSLTKKAVADDAKKKKEDTKQGGWKKSEPTAA